MTLHRRASELRRAILTTKVSLKAEIEWTDRNSATYLWRALNVGCPLHLDWMASTPAAEVWWSGCRSSRCGASLWHVWTSMSWTCDATLLLLFKLELWQQKSEGLSVQMMHWIQCTIVIQRNFKNIFFVRWSCLLSWFFGVDTKTKYVECFVGFLKLLKLQQSQPEVGLTQKATQHRRRTIHKDPCLKSLFMRQKLFRPSCPSPDCYFFHKAQASRSCFQLQPRL